MDSSFGPESRARLWVRLNDDDTHGDDPTSPISNMATTMWTMIKLCGGQSVRSLSSVERLAAPFVI